MSPKKLSQMLKARREEQGLSQVDLAKRAHVGRTYIVKLESGAKKNPSLDILQKLAKALGVQVAELLG